MRSAVLFALFLLPGCAADLRNTDLQGANLQGANLRSADFRGANLEGAQVAPTPYCMARAIGPLRAGPPGKRVRRAGASRGGACCPSPTSVSGSSPAAHRNMKVGRAPTCPDHPVSHYCSPVVCSEIEGADLTNARWEGAICPDGTRADEHGGTCEGHFHAR